MAWYEENGKEYKYVLSTRIRFARNLADYPFASRMDKTSADEIVERVRGVFTEYEYTDFIGLDPVKQRSFVEAHLASPDFLSSRFAHGLLTHANTYIMIGEEDHLRIQAIYPGLALDEAYKEASDACDRVEDKLNIAYDSTFGYLTHCPTNLGTGMRASVMLFLPALTITGQMDKIALQISKLGLTIRGSYGEGSDESGYLYQVSNQVTLGVSEDDTITKLKEIVSTIIESEKRMENALDEREQDKLRDLCNRALGTMKYATLLSSAEFMDLYGKVRMGLNMGYIDDVKYEELDRLSVVTQPATLTLETKCDDAAHRDKARAAQVRKELNNE
jgi:protein arginine kinase